MPKGVPKNPAATSAKRGEANPRGTIKAASASFREMLNDGGLRPSVFLLGRMRNDARYFDEGEVKVPMPERIAIADKLVQFELPRLAAIEAEIEHVGKSHEEWVREFANDEAAEPEERTLQ